MMKGAISFKQVSKIFPPDTHAITDVNLDITEGEFMTVVGPSGCGKSTLLRMVAGLESPTSGKIEIFGKDAKKLLPQDRNLGMVFQNYALFPHLSVFENIAYGLKVRHQSLPEIHQKVDRVAQKLEIADTLKRKPHQLSGGQRQRVALGRLLARDPGIHLFDEPLGNLDPQFRTGMRAELARLHQENPKSTLYVTHDQAEAMTLGHRICVLRNGRVLQIGTPEQIYQEPAHRFVATFFGSPGAQCIDGRIERSASGETEFVAGSIRIPLPQSCLPDGSITLGVRPEDWEISPSENGQICGHAERVENLGDHRMVELATEGINIFVKTYTLGISENESLKINLQPEKAHWFERYTGKRITN
jgi:ABC-type sugar transport system ATPase subunit